MTAARRIKLKLPPPTPRNPLVAPALLRKAGSHRKNSKSQRAAQKAADRAALMLGHDGDG